MKIAILGYGKQGSAAYDYWRSAENQITVCDQNEALELPNDVVRQLGPDHLKNLSQFDLIIRSPVVHPRDIVAANSPAILDKVTTVTNEFFRVCPSQNIIGVTGTKGKGTTCTLIAKLLEANGKKVHLGGNIGTPPLELLKNGISVNDYVILELANFQLIDLKYSPGLAVCLMVVPEHLDWHTDMAEYIKAKEQLFVHQKSDDIAVYYSENENSKKIAEVSPGQKIPYFAKPGALIENKQVKINGQTLCPTGELKLLGKHNWQNVCAAVTAVWQISQDVEAAKAVLTSFSGLEHRLEFVRELDGVKYYDDSFGTTPETAIVALEAFSQPKVIILGGSDKGATYDALANTIAKSEIRQVVVIGNTDHPNYKSTGPAIEETLKGQGISNITSLVKAGKTSMNDIVQAARSAAQPGDIVLLSAASASFDMFKNYEDRGQQFKQSVLALV